MKKEKSGTARNHSKRLLFDSLTLVSGGILFALAFHSFLLPCKIVIGGISGLSSIFYFLFRLPVGALNLLLNLPIFFLAFRRYGGRVLSRSVAGTLSVSLFLDLLSFFPPLVAEPLLGAVFGGVLLGGATALLFERGFTSGGTDLLAMLLHEKLRSVSISRWILLLDAVIIGIGALARKDISGIFYSLATALSFSLFLDYAQRGVNSAKAVYIISERSGEISVRICREIGRGITVLYGRLWFSEKEAEILLCTVRRRELYRLRDLICDCDEKAFVIVTEATEVYGTRFLTKSRSLIDIE